MERSETWHSPLTPRCLSLKIILRYVLISENRIKLPWFSVLTLPYYRCNPAVLGDFLNYCFSFQVRVFVKELGGEHRGQWTQTGRLCHHQMKWLSGLQWSVDHKKSPELQSLIVSHPSFAFHTSCRVRHRIRKTDNMLFVGFVLFCFLLFLVWALPMPSCYFNFISVQIAPFLPLLLVGR